MNKYYLRLETVDNKTLDVIDSELVDVYSANSITECLNETGWRGADTKENEQYCIDEEDEDGCEIGWYYPFGEAKIIEEYEKRIEKEKVIWTYQLEQGGFGIVFAESAMEAINKVSAAYNDHYGGGEFTESIKVEKLEGGYFSDHPDVIEVGDAYGV